MTLGETVALYRVWDPSSVEHHTETAFLKPGNLYIYIRIFNFLCVYVSLKAPVISSERLPPGAAPHLYSQNKGFRCSLVLIWWLHSFLPPLYILTPFHPHFITVILSVGL